MGARLKKVRYSEGDLFLIPSLDGTYYVGQIAQHAAKEIGANLCYLFRNKVDASQDCSALQIRDDQIVGAIFITPELLEHGTWQVCGHQKIFPHKSLERLSALRAASYVGMVVVGAGLISDYLDTYFGLIDDSHWPDPRLVYENFVARTSGAHGLVH